MSTLTGGAAGFRRVPAFLSYGFRPFFFAAGLWSALALLLWIAVFVTGSTLPRRFDPLAWHIHEMLCGFVMAAIAGFVLTAIPNWTGRQPLSGVSLAVLATLWLLGRVSCLISTLLPSWLALVTDLLFPLLLIAVVSREIVAARNWRHLPMIGGITVLAVGDLMMHLEAVGVALPAGLGWRFALAAIIVLISVVGGRIVPSFTRNWLVKQGAVSLPAEPDGIDRIALGILHGGLFAWVFFPVTHAVGALLLLAAALNFWRLLRWRGGATLAEPFLLVLHVGYGWVVLGTALLGLAIMDADIPQSLAIHALTAGAIGTMTVAVMTRATRGHTGHPLSADRATIAIYLCVNAAAIVRIAAAIGGSWAMPMLAASAILWVGAFALFALVYAPMLLLPKRVNL